MIKFINKFTCAALLFCGSEAARAAVLVELFTSMGCSSCPPADEFLQELRQDEELVTLAFHVDYWDYLGFPDHFANPFFTQRQYAYAAGQNEKQVYTPNIWVGGQESLVGSNRAKVHAAIKAAQTAEFTDQSREYDTSFALRLAPQKSLLGEFDLVLAYTLPPQDVPINAGENRGETIRYVDVVSKMENLGSWDGQSEIAQNIEKISGLGAVFFVQERGLGRVVFAKKLN